MVHQTMPTRIAPASKDSKISHAMQQPLEVRASRGHATPRPTQVLEVVRAAHERPRASNQRCPLVLLVALLASCQVTPPQQPVAPPTVPAPAAPARATY